MTICLDEIVNLKREKRSEILDVQRRDAVSNRDALKYFTACQEGGYSRGEAPELYEQGERIHLAEEDRQARDEEHFMKHKEFQDKFPYIAFGKDIEKGEYEPNHQNKNPEMKADLLKKHGIKWLTTGKGEGTPTSRAKPSRIGQAFRQYWKGYLTRKDQ